MTRAKRFRAFCSLENFTSPAGGVRSAAISVSVRLSVCLSVCQLAYFKNDIIISSHSFLYVLRVAVTRSSADDSAVCLCTSFFVYDVVFSHKWSLRHSELFIVTRQVAPPNCAPGAESAIADCLFLSCNVPCKTELA